MAVRAVSGRSNDRFEVKCPICGTTLQYSRRDVRPHGRWPNGFIYCRSCKQPVGHNESNMIASSEEIFEEEMRREGRILTEEEKTNIKQSITALSAGKVICLLFGLLLIIVPAIAFFVINGSTKVSPADKPILGMLMFLLIMFGIGLLIIRGAALGNMINHKKKQLEFSERLERESER